MKRSFSILLSFVMITVGMNITFANHYCGGNAVKSTISLGHVNLNCGMVTIDLKTCNEEDNERNLIRMRCCENHFSILTIDSDYTLSEIKSQSPNYKLISTFMIVLINNFIFKKKNVISLLVYSPPLILQDKSVLFQVFRI